MPQVQSTPTSPDSFKRGDGQDTGTQTGGSKASPFSKHKPTPTTSPTSSKPDGEPESSSTSNTNLGLASPLSDEAEQRKHELDGYLEAEAAVPQKKKQRINLPVPNENHMKLRAIMEKGNKWEHDLKEVHGLSEEEVAMVVGIVLKHLNEDKFPDFDSTSTTGLSFYRALAKPGWHAMKENKKLLDKCPEESAEQICRGGVWRMIANSLPR